MITVILIVSKRQHEKNKWEPKYMAGEFAIANTAEFEKYVHAPTMIVEILERDKNTSKHYYRVMTKDIPLLTDAKNKPIDFYIHEKNIIGPCVDNN